MIRGGTIGAVASNGASPPLFGNNRNYFNLPPCNPSADLVYYVPKPTKGHKQGQKKEREDNDKRNHNSIQPHGLGDRF